jgi:GntP family gluconate:H+ symporter
MDNLAVLSLGIAVVVLGIMVFRLHAFLALTAGAFVIAQLTPAHSIVESQLYTKKAHLIAVDGDKFQLQTDSKWSLQAGTYAVVTPGTSYLPLTKLPLVSLQKKDSQTDPKNNYRFSNTIAGIQTDLPQPVMHSQLIALSDLKAAQRVADLSAMERISAGMGDTYTKIGIMIAMAAVLGQCMLLNGSAQRIVLTLRQVLGEQNTALAFVISSFILAIPIFFETVFYLMLPLAKAMAQQVRKDYLKYVLSIVVGGTLAHSLVPPTPGPLLVADALHISIATMFLGGVSVGIFGVAAGYLYMLWANRRWSILIPELESTPEGTAKDATVTSSHSLQPAILPSFWLAILPILLPVIFLGTHACWKELIAMKPAVIPDSLNQTLTPYINFWGDSDVAIAIAAITSLLTLICSRHLTKKQISTQVQHALSDGGLILLIICAGGALGHIIRQTNIVASLGGMFPTSGSGIGLLVMAFFVTMIIRVAQGSATIAMLTSVSIIAPIAAAANLPYHPVYVALAIGCGSKPMPWMNDGGFWLIARMSGMNEVETLRTFTVLLTIMGFVSFGATITFALLFPFK